MEEITNQEVVNEEEVEVTDENVECEEYVPTLGESILTAAILAAPLAISYVVGVVSGDKVKAGARKLKDGVVNKFNAAKSKTKTKKALPVEEAEITEDSENN